MARLISRYVQVQQLSTASVWPVLRTVTFTELHALDITRVSFSASVVRNAVPLFYLTTHTSLLVGSLKFT
jgi:hypothetical protein